MAKHAPNGRLLRALACGLIFLLAAAGLLLFFHQFTQTAETVKLSWSASNANGWAFADETGAPLTAEEAAGYAGTLSMSRTVEALPERYVSQYATLNLSCSGLSDLQIYLDGALLYDAPGAQDGTLRVSLPRDAAGQTLTIAWTQEGRAYASISLSDRSMEALNAAASDAEWMIPTAAFAVITLLVLGLFLLSGVLDCFRWPLLALMLAPLSQTLYWARNYWSISVSSSPALTAITYLALLLYWAPPLYLLLEAGLPKRKWWLLAWAVLAVLDAALMPLLTFGVMFVMTLPQWLITVLVKLPYVLKWLGVALLAASSVTAFRRKNALFRLFAPLYLAAVVLRVAYAFAFGRGMTDIWLSLPGTPLYFLAVFAQVLALAVSLIDFVRRMAQRETELTMVSAREQLSRQQLAVMETASRSVRTMRHDMLGHYTVMQTLLREGQTERLSAYLAELTAQAEAVPATAYTAHPTVNAILTAMLARAQAQGMRTETKVELPAELTIADTDLCTLLMNLLENALEANKTAAAGAGPWLRVTMHIKGSYLYVGVENSRFTPVEPDGEWLFRTTKADSASHGFGLKAAQSVARKYHGELLLKAPEGEFSASTALKMLE